MTTPPNPREASEYERGFQDGRQLDARLIHGKARAAFDTLTKAGLAEEAGAMWAEIARLQAIVCYACEASMDAGRAREEAQERAAEAMQLTHDAIAREDMLKAALAAQPPAVGVDVLLEAARRIRESWEPGKPGDYDDDMAFAHELERIAALTPTQDAAHGGRG